MRLLGADLPNMPGIPATIAFSSVPPFVTILHAEDGPFGRRVVDLLCAAKERIGPYGVIGPAPWPARMGRASVTLRVELDAEERDFAATEELSLEATARLGATSGEGMEHHHHGLAALFARHAGDGSVGRFERIPTERSLEGGAPGGSLPSLRKALHLSAHPKKLAGLPQLLTDAARDETNVAERFAAALARLGAEVVFDGARSAGGRSELAFRRKGRSEGLFDLGHDEQQLVLFAGFFATYPARRSILFVEEPELHQGERAVKRLIDGMVALAEGNQLVLTTRSAAVARACPGAAVVAVGGS